MPQILQKTPVTVGMKFTLKAVAVKKLPPNMRESAYVQQQVAQQLQGIDAQAQDEDVEAVQQEDERKEEASSDQEEDDDRGNRKVLVWEGGQTMCCNSKNFTRIFAKTYNNLWIILFISAHLDDCDWSRHCC